MTYMKYQIQPPCAVCTCTWRIC